MMLTCTILSTLRLSTRPAEAHLADFVHSLFLAALVPSPGVQGCKGSHGLLQQLVLKLSL